MTLVKTLVTAPLMIVKLFDDYYINFLFLFLLQALNALLWMMDWSGMGGCIYIVRLPSDMRAFVALEIRFRCMFSAEVRFVRKGTDESFRKRNEIALYVSMM